MNRDFSIIRRRPHVLDLMTPVRAGVTGYRFESAPNFDQPYTTILTTALGYVDPLIDTAANVIMPTNNRIRIIFDPSNYGLDDNKTFWMRFVPITGGIPGTPGTGVMVLPDAIGNGLIVLSGMAPVGATIVNSIELGLPGLVEDLRIVNNDTANPMFIASDGSDAEYKLDPIQSSTPLVALRGAVSSIRVRATGAPVLFSATCTLAFAR